MPFPNARAVGIFQSSHKTVEVSWTEEWKTAQSSDVPTELEGGKPLHRICCLRARLQAWSFRQNRTSRRVVLGSRKVAAAAWMPQTTSTLTRPLIGRPLFFHIARFPALRLKTWPIRLRLRLRFSFPAPPLKTPHICEAAIPPLKAPTFRAEERIIWTRAVASTLPPPFSAFPHFPPGHRPWAVPVTCFDVCVRQQSSQTSGP